MVVALAEGVLLLPSPEPVASSQFVLAIPENSSTTAPKEVPVGWVTVTVSSWTRAVPMLALRMTVRTWADESAMSTSIA